MDRQTLRDWVHRYNAEGVADLLAVAQAVEHYEISRCGTLKCWAEELAIDGAVALPDAMGARRDARCDHHKMRVHGFGVGVGHENGGAGGAGLHHGVERGTAG